MCVCLCVNIYIYIYYIDVIQFNRFNWNQIENITCSYTLVYTLVVEDKLMLFKVNDDNDHIREHMLSLIVIWTILGIK